MARELAITRKQRGAQSETISRVEADLKVERGELRVHPQLYEEFGGPRMEAEK